MAGGGQMGGGQPPSGAYGSPNFDSSNPINQPSSGSGMNPFRQTRGMLGGMAGLGISPALPAAGTPDSSYEMANMPPQSMMNDPYFRPMQNYMYSPFMSMQQYNPYTRGYFGADPMYGGYSPFIPRMPTPAGMYTGANRNRLADIDADMKAEEANQEGKRRRPLGHGAYEYY